MPKRFFEVKEITKQRYFELCEQNDAADDPRLVNASSKGTTPVNKKHYLAYTDDESLEIQLEE